MIFVVLMCCHVVAVLESQMALERTRECKSCIANGSKYQVKVCYAQETQTANSPDTSSPDNNAFKSHSPTTADNPDEADQSFVVDIGDVSAFVSARYLSIFLCNTETTHVPPLKGWKPEPGSGNMSIIVTEEGGVQFGNADTADSVWISRPEGVNHRPRKSFVANASKSILTVTSATGDGKRNVQPGETTTVEYENIVISFGDKNFPVITKPRTSIVVFPGEIGGVTGQLYGDNIEDLKWKVDGEKCKPLSYWEQLEPVLRHVESAVAPNPSFFTAALKWLPGLWWNK